MGTGRRTSNRGSGLQPLIEKDVSRDERIGTQYVMKFLLVILSIGLLLSSCSVRSRVRNPQNPIFESVGTGKPVVQKIKVEGSRAKSDRDANHPFAALEECVQRSTALTDRDSQNIIETGVASWYGPGFHGKRTASGTMYDQHALTAAHRTLPFETVAWVTNLDNGKTVEVVITDRGPFRDGRMLDLSMEAAKIIDMKQRGLAPVQLEAIEHPGNVSNYAYAVQVGSYRKMESARFLERCLAGIAPRVYIRTLSATGSVHYQVRVGPFSERVEADEKAIEVSRNGFEGTVVVERESTNP